MVLVVIGLRKKCKLDEVFEGFFILIVVSKIRLYVIKEV